MGHYACVSAEPKIVTPNGVGGYRGREAEYVWRYDTERKEWIVPLRQARYIEWVLTPKAERKPRTLAEFARLNGFNPETVYRWKRDQRFKDALKKAAENVNYSTERIQDVIDAMWERACNGDVKAAALYLQYVQALTPTQKLVIQDESLANKSDEELKAMLAAAMDELGGR